MSVTLFQVYSEAGEMTHQWTSLDHGPDYSEPSFGTAYTIQSTDITGTPRDPRMIALRAERNTRLAASDWTQIGDSPLTNSERAAWATYRQALRTLPDQPDLNLDSPAWPNPPEATP